MTLIFILAYGYLIYKLCEIGYHLIKLRKEVLELYEQEKRQ